LLSFLQRLSQLTPKFPLLLLFWASVGSHIFGNSANHTVWIEESGAVKATGSNEYGQLGLEVLRESHHPIPSKFGVVQVASGQKHSVYLMSDGTVWAAGLNSDGQLGDGTTTPRNNPVQVMNADGTGLSGVIGISAGLTHTVYLKSDGTVWAAGYNSYGQLGDGTTTNRTNPVQVTNVDGSILSGVVGLFAGNYHTVYLKSDGTAWAVGSNSLGQLGDGATTNRTNPVQVTNADGIGLNGVVGISAGGNHTVYLKSDGTVWATGVNSSGQLGDGTTTQRKNPVQVTNGDGSGLSGVVGISAGGVHSVYLKSDGTVWASGSNYKGQIGDGSTTNRTNPVQVTNVDGSVLNGVVGISTGDWYTVYLKSDGSVWAGGYNNIGQLGDGTTTDSSNPVQVKNADGTGLNGVVGISASFYHTVYLKSDGTVWAAGYNFFGQLGDGTTTDSTTPVQVVKAPGGGLSHIIKTSSGGNHNGSHNLLLRADGTVLANGYNGWGQLGDGTTTDRNISTPMVNADGSLFDDVKDISAGILHTLLVKNDGTAWALGGNFAGRLGDGTSTHRSNPIQVKNSDGSFLTGVSTVSAGGDHSIFLKEDGTVWGAGGNNYGQIGDGTGTHKSYASQVTLSGGTALSDIVSVRTGNSHSVFLKSDGTVWATGRNTFGQLGDGTTTTRLNPVQVINVDGTELSGVIGISVGHDHTVYLKNDGTVWACGSNSDGRLGDGTTTNRSNPVQVTNADGSVLSGVVGISAGGYHTVYLKSDGTVWAAGRNDTGQ
jgi:alpha-tubulin suppressor-like RCC1 family protein